MTFLPAASSSAVAFPFRATTRGGAAGFFFRVVVRCGRGRGGGGRPFSVVAGASSPVAERIIGGGGGGMASSSAVVLAAESRTTMTTTSSRSVVFGRPLLLPGGGKNRRRPASSPSSFGGDEGRGAPAAAVVFGGGGVLPPNDVDRRPPFFFPMAAAAVPSPTTTTRRRRPQHPPPPPPSGGSFPSSSSRRFLSSGAGGGGRVLSSDRDDDDDDASESPSSKIVLDDCDPSSPSCNVPPGIYSKIGSDLHRRPSHPLGIVKTVIENYYQSLRHHHHRGGDEDEDDGRPPYRIVDDLSPVVTTSSNFDSLLIPVDHPSRSTSDTYYFDRSTVLRTHTSAHQAELIRRGERRFLVTGDVYRRDEIDSSHYPVFHQMEGVRLFEDDDELLRVASASSPSFSSSEGGGGGKATTRTTSTILSESERVSIVEKNLKDTLEGMAKALFGDDAEMRWVDEYFPFTDPSYELEIYHKNQWLEVLGCGVVRQEIVRANSPSSPSFASSSSSRGERKGWAFGLGLERLAMILFKIPDIRLFWTDDDRFTSQFEEGKVTEFVPYSRYPPCFKDVSFWTSPPSPSSSDDDDPSSSVSSFHENDLHELVREIAGDLVETVSLVDEFVHPQTNRASKCYRISYRSMDRSLTNEEVDELQTELRCRLTKDGNRLGLELR